MLSAAAFVAGDVAGILLTPGYSPVDQAISELIETGAPAKQLIDTFLLIFHGAVIPFALGLGRQLKGRAGYLGAVLLAAAGLTGLILTIFFPCDSGCAPLTWRGTMHIFLAIPMGFAVLFAILAFSFAFRRRPAGRAFASYSMWTFGTGVALAVVTVGMAETRWVGVLERLLTVSYLQWYAVIGYRLAQGARVWAQP